MCGKLKLFLMALFLIVCFAYFTNDVKAADPIEGCWSLTGLVKATAKVRGRSGSEKGSFSDTLCFNADGTFYDSNGSGTWVYWKKKYKLTYNTSSLNVDLINELQYYFDDVTATFTKAEWTLTRNKKDQLRGAANFIGFGSLDYNWETYNYKFAVKTTLKPSYRISYSGYYSAGSDQDLPANSVGKTSGMPGEIVNNVGTVIQDGIMR